MILDSSAVLSILFEEPGSNDLLRKLSDPQEVGIGAPTLVETAVVLTSRLGPSSRELLEKLLQRFSVVVLPFEDIHWREALDAYQRFGKGRHRASLNFGDCMSYATARVAGRPLLCVGEDFVQTDLPLA